MEEYWKKTFYSIWKVHYIYNLYVYIIEIHNMYIQQCLKVKHCLMYVCVVDTNAWSYFSFSFADVFVMLKKRRNNIDWLLSFFLFLHCLHWTLPWSKKVALFFGHITDRLPVGSTVMSLDGSSIILVLL